MNKKAIIRNQLCSSSKLSATFVLRYDSHKLGGLVHGVENVRGRKEDSKRSLKNSTKDGRKFDKMMNLIPIKGKESIKKNQNQPPNVTPKNT
jgi:hypothetical protein